MSERALAYSQEPLAHRIMVIYEAAGLSGDFASYLMRSLLSEGCVRYETVESTPEGIRPRLIEREGPTGLLLTTTAVHPHPENETRLLSLYVDDGQEQTRAVLLSLADEAKHDDAVNLAEWRAFQEWLETAEHRVTIPYRKALAELVPPLAVRLRRDFGMVLNLIRTNALLHQAIRTKDEDGRIIANFDDYNTVYEIAGPLIAEGISATVSKAARDTVEAVKALQGKGGPDTGVSVTQLAEYLKLDKGATSRRVKVCIYHGYLENLETAKGRPARLVLGDALPDDHGILPSPDKLAAKLTEVLHRCTVDGGDTEPTSP